MWAAAAAAGVLLATGAAGPANALLGNPDALPAGSIACTDWVRSSQGATIRGYADYNQATFTTRVSSTPGGPETVLFRSVTRQITPEFSGVLVTPASGGSHYLRNCLEATGGPVYRYQLTITSSDRSGLADVGPHQATLGPGGYHCGDYVEGPSVGRDDGVARLTGTATAPVRFDIVGTNEDWGYIGPVFSVTATGVDQVFVPQANVSSLKVCVTNTSSGTATAEFELTAL
jgi:hypothetical protein